MGQEVVQIFGPETLHPLFHYICFNHAHVFRALCPLVRPSIAGPGREKRRVVSLYTCCGAWHFVGLRGTKWRGGSFKCPVFAPDDRVFIQGDWTDTLILTVRSRAKLCRLLRLVPSGRESSMNNLLRSVGPAEVRGNFELEEAGGDDDVLLKVSEPMWSGHGGRAGCETW